jgi:hypothetical protein
MLGNSKPNVPRQQGFAKNELANLATRNNDRRLRLLVEFGIYPDCTRGAANYCEPSASMALWHTKRIRIARGKETLQILLDVVSDLPRSFSCMED